MAERQAIERPRRPACASRSEHAAPAPAHPRPSTGAAAQLVALHATLQHGPLPQPSAKGPGGGQTAVPPRANRTGLPDRLKAGAEALSGISLDDVRVHRNSPKPAQLNALAYAQGSDIHLGPGEERQLPHEAWHVVQQKQGRVKPTMQMKEGVPINDTPALEREADAMGARALSSTPAVHGTAVQTAIRSTSSAQAVQRRLRLNALQLADAAIADRWNAIHDIIEPWRGNRNEQLEQWVATAEASWNNTRQLNWQTSKLGSFKNVVYAAAEADKKNEDGADNLGWDGMIEFLRAQFDDSPFVTLTVEEDVRLTGGHGRGDTWSLTVALGAAANDEIVSGTVPNADHGRSDQARTGARRSIKTGLTGHNGLVDELKQNVEAV